MKIITLFFATLLSYSVLAAPSTIKCYNTYVEANATTTLEASILDSQTLSNIEIKTKLDVDPQNPIDNVVLKSSVWSLKPTIISGYEVFVNAEHASKMEVVSQTGKTVPLDFSVMFSIGSKWIDYKNLSMPLAAQILFYCDLCGGSGAIQPNLYCKLN